MTAIYYNYSLIRNNISNGDIIFVIGENRKCFCPIQRLIMWATGSQYTHVGIAFWANIEGSNNPRLMIVESQGGSSRRLLNLSYYQNNNFDVITAPKPWNEVADEALESVGKVPYGYMDALWVGIRERFQITFNINLPRYNFKGETCSEFVARLYNLNYFVVSPQTLYEELSANKHQIKLQYRVK